MKTLVDIIMPTYNRIEALHCMLSSLICQTDKDWNGTVVIDNEFCKEVIPIIMMIQNFNDERIAYVCTGKRHNDWGHTPREMGKQMSEAEYIIMSGDDNYYTPTFVAELRKASLSRPGMIYWDMVHSHYDYQFFECQPAYNQIDMGAFATRSDLAKQIKLNTSYAADGEYVRDFNIKFPQEQKIKIPKCLFVHN